MQKEQRVGVFVDVQNLYYSARNLYKSKINFKELLKEAVAGRKLIRAIAYSIRLWKRLALKLKQNSCRYFTAEIKKETGMWELQWMPLSWRIDWIPLF